MDNGLISTCFVTNFQEMGHMAVFSLARWPNSEGWGPSQGNMAAWEASRELEVATSEEVEATARDFPGATSARAEDYKYKTWVTFARVQAPIKKLQQHKE